MRIFHALAERIMFMALQLTALKDAIASLEATLKENADAKAQLAQAQADMADAQAQVDALVAQLKASSQ